jgi:hypothetical protein
MDKNTFNNYVNSGTQDQDSLVIVDQKIQDQIDAEKERILAESNIGGGAYGIGPNSQIKAPVYAEDSLVSKIADRLAKAPSAISDYFGDIFKSDPQSDYNRLVLGKPVQRKPSTPDIVSTPDLAATTQGDVAAKETAASAPPVSAAKEQVSTNPTKNGPIRTWQDLYAAQPTTGDKHEIKKQFVDNKRAEFMKAAVNAASQMPPSDRMEYLNFQKIRLDANLPQLASVTDSKYFKTQSEIALRAGYLQNQYTLYTLHNQLSDAKEMLRQGKKTEAVAFLQANIPKVLQSIATGQSDAIQPSEATRLLPELKTIFMNPSSYAEFMSMRGGFWKSFSTDPQAFIDKATKIYEAGAGAMNQIYDPAYQSLGSSVKDTGLRRFNDTVGIKGNIARSDVQNIQNILKQRYNVDMGFGEDTFTALQKPRAEQVGQSSTPVNGSNFRLGKIVNGNVRQSFDDSVFNK